MCVIGNKFIKHVHMKDSKSSANPPGFEPRAVAWQSITLPLRHVSSPQDKLTKIFVYHVNTKYQTIAIISHVNT